MMASPVNRSFRLPLRFGAGLGLAIAKGIVEAHGGRIWAESTMGAGACFAFVLPDRRAKGLSNNNFPLWPVSDRASSGTCFFTRPKDVEASRSC